LVLNRVLNGASELQKGARTMGLDLLDPIPSDKNVVNYDRLGLPSTDLTDDSPSVLAVRRILNGLGLAS
jgi:CO dehydrogenase nickel-insertion accessory protein CooC1